MPLFAFPVRGVFAAKPAVFAELQFVRSCALVFGGVVVALPAFCADQTDDDSQ